MLFNNINFPLLKEGWRLTVLLSGSQVKCSINIQGPLAKWACFDITRLDSRKQSSLVVVHLAGQEKR